MSPVLEQILFGGSSVSLNLLEITPHIEHAESRMFRCHALNQTIVFKYPSFSERLDDDVSAWFDPDEEFSDDFRPIETALYIPNNTGVPDGGGHAIYLRQENYEGLVREYLGLDVTDRDPEFQRDVHILNALDGIPSLDAFLVRTCFEVDKLIVDDRYFAISEEEDYQIRRIIAQRIEPIIRKALDHGAGAGGSRIDRFLEAIWDPQLPEAKLFISAFGIREIEAAPVFAAWKGVTFYEYQLRRTASRVRKFQEWLKSPASIPVDIRMNKMYEPQLNMFKQKIAQQIEKVLYDLKAILNDYEVCYKTFLEGEPRHFINFLKAVRKKYWLMGYCVSSLSSVSHIYSRFTRNAPENRLHFEKTNQMLRQMDVAMNRRREREASF